MLNKLNGYVAIIKLAKTDKEIKDILEYFYFESMCSPDFRKQINDDMFKGENEINEN